MVESLPKPLSSKPMHVKANTASGKEKFVNLVIFMLQDFIISTNINSTFSKISNPTLGERDVTY